MKLKAAIIFLALQLLAGAQSGKIAFLGSWDRAVPLIEKASRETKIEVKFFKREQFLSDANPALLNGVKILYILNISPEAAPKVRGTLEAAFKADPELKVIPLDHRGIHQEINKNGVLTKNSQVQTYWKANGLTNMKRLLQFTEITFFGKPGEIKPAAIIPGSGFYSPEFEEIFTSFETFKSKCKWERGAPAAAFLIQQSFWITEDTKVINAQIKALQDEGFNVVTFFADNTETVYAYLNEVKPDIVVEDRQGSIWEGEGDQNILEKLNVPYMRPISMLAATIEEWRKNPQGLVQRDVNHFMTLQESKGIIEPIVVGGLKANITGFRLHEPIEERIKHFAARASAWVNLKRKANKEKKVAIIYYNKSLGKDDLMRGSPTGAFLDGPESLVQFLPVMDKAGLDRKSVV